MYIHMLIPVNLVNTNLKSWRKGDAEQSGWKRQGKVGPQQTSCGKRQEEQESAERDKRNNKRNNKGTWTEEPLGSANNASCGSPGTNTCQCAPEGPPKLSAKFMPSACATRGEEEEEGEIWH